MVVKAFEDGGSSGMDSFYKKMLKPGVSLEVWQPSYNKGITLIRPWATIDKETGQPISWRDENGNYGTSFFIRDRAYLRFGLDRAFNVFADVAEEDAEEWTGGSPIDVFVDEILAHPDFKAMYSGRGSGAAKDCSAVSTAKEIGFIKGLMFECCGKDYKQNPRWGVLLMLPKSAVTAADQLFEQVVDPSRARNDPARYLVGNPTDADHGKVIEFHAASKLTKSKAPGDEGSTGVLGTSVTKSVPSAADGRPELYGAQLWPTQPELALPLEDIRKFDRSYEDIFRYLTAREQVNEILIPAFGRKGREALLYVFAGKGVLPAAYENNRVLMEVPTAPAPVTSSCVPTSRQAPAPQAPAPQAPAVPAAPKPASTGLLGLSISEDQLNPKEPVEERKEPVEEYGGDTAPFDGDEAPEEGEVSATPSTADLLRARLGGLK